MKNRKKIVTLGVVLLTAAVFVGCQSDIEHYEEGEQNQASTQAGSATNAGNLANNVGGEVSFAPINNAVLEAFLGPEPANRLGYTNFAHTPGSLAQQIALPSAGEVFAVIHTNHGAIYARLFPEQAPLAVRNFATHANNGFFDGLTFHRVIPDFMLQGGCTLGNGMGGETIWGSNFGDELTSNLRHIRGALSMANTGAPMSNSSQFFVVQNQDMRPISADDLEHLIEYADMSIAEYFAGQALRPELDGLYVRDVFPAEFMQHYYTYGGTRHLDFGHTVFGQVFYGMDVVDAIAGVPLVPVAFPDQPSVPVDTVYIITVELRIWN